MATTTIPWGDGSGENIYLTYSSASGNQTVAVSSDANGGSVNRTKTITFTAGNVTQTLTVLQEGIAYDALVDYIAGTGTQYIDLGLTVTNLHRLYLEFSIDDTSQAGQRIFGSRYNSGTRGFDVMMASTAPLFADMWNSSYRALVRPATANIVYVVEIDKNARTIKSGGVVLASNTTLFSQTFTTPGNVRLFDCQNGVSGTCFIGKIYSCKIWNGETLVRDLVPVRVGTTGYMYDLVGKGLYGNVGTGSFTVGPDKT